MNQECKPPAIWTWTVTDAPGRADSVILKAFLFAPPPDANLSVTRSQLQKWIEEGRVTADGQRIKASTQLKSGSRIQVEFPAPQPLNLVAENRKLEIVFEDEHLLVINKPQDLTVHPSSTQTQGTLVHALLHHIKDLSGIGGVLRPGIVHRIDKNTSGALVITKTDLAHTRLAEIFAQHAIERAYWAICYGTPPSTLATRIESTLGRSPQDRKKMSMNVKGGKKAITFYRKLREFSIPTQKPFASWMEVTLETGRTHQIRVHLTGIGHSILGDPVYGTPTHNQAKWKALPRGIQECVKSLPGQALHARVLGFRHPVTQENLRFEVDPPPAFANLLQQLEEFTPA